MELELYSFQLSTFFCISVIAMEYKILLDSHSNTREVEMEEQTKFIMSVVEALEVPYQWSPDTPFTVLEKLKLRKALSQYHIAVIDDMDGGVVIWLENEKIAQWQKASYLLKEDLVERDSRKRYFIEMQCKFSSIFDQPKEMNG